MKEILRNLSLQSVPSGREDKMAETIRKYLSESCSKIYVDNLGSTIAVQKSKNDSPKRIMIAAHSDEISMMVGSIDENGFIKFIPVGGIDSRILLAQEVIIHGRKELPGVIGAKPPHILSAEEKKKEIKIEDLFIDTGLSVEQLKNAVRVGDYITFKPIWGELQNNIVSGKSLDNRAGLAVMIGIAKELSDHELDMDIIYTATSQEEVGLRGATVSAYGIEPDIAVVLDGTFGDMPGVEKEDSFVLGKGPAIAVGPNLHKKITSELMEFAKIKSIPFQIDVQPGDTGTDAWAIQTIRDGIPVILLSIPLRYMHTTVETISIEDIENTVKLISQFILSIQGRMEELLWY